MFLKDQTDQYLIPSKDGGIASLETVDYVSENKWRDAVETIKLLKPNVYCKGPDYKKIKTI